MKKLTKAQKAAYPEFIVYIDCTAKGSEKTGWQTFKKAMEETNILDAMRRVETLIQERAEDIYLVEIYAKTGEETDIGEPISAREDIQDNLDILRERSRDLYMGVPLATGAVKTMRTNVVGRGLRLKPTLDREVLGLEPEKAHTLERQIEREWGLWADSPDCDMARIDNFYELQQLAFLSWLTSGDCLALLPTKARKNQPYDLRVQLVEADRLSSPGGYDTLMKTGKDEKEIADLMAEEKWWTGDDAVGNGFCDELMFEDAKAVVENSKKVIVNSVALDVSAYKTLPIAIFDGPKNPGGPKNNMEKPKEEETMEPKNTITTVEALAAAYPDLVNSIKDAAAKNERERIKGIMDSTLDGYEDVAKDAMFENPINAGDFALKITAAERQAKAVFLDGREEDAKAAAGVVPTASEKGGETMNIFGATR